MNKLHFPSRRKRARLKSTGNRQRISGRRLSHELLEDRRVLASWVPSGPSPIINGGTENVAPNNEVNGAIRAVVAHPTDADTLYIGSVNGGIWKTDNATDTQPSWVALTDHLQSLSIGDLEMDPTDPNTLLAGVGRSSAFAGEGGQLTGLQLTRDGGASWTEITDPLFAEKEISAVTIRGDLILAASNGGFTEIRDVAAIFGTRTGGLFRSADGGETWESIEILERDTARPDEPAKFNAFDLAADPTDANRYYLSIQDEGIFRTEDGGQTWENVNDNVIQQAIDTQELGFDDDGTLLFAPALPGLNNNTELTISNDGRLFAGILQNNQVEYIGYSDDQGGSWTQMDLPFTPDIEDGRLVGLQPRPKEGAQGLIHFSLKVDPTDSDIIYIGGDRQGGDTLFPNGNSIGAQDSVGRLFRGDVTVPPLDLGFNPTIDLPIDLENATEFDLLPFISEQWEHLTHSDTVLFTPDGGTAHNSAPHADSRGMALDANGDLIEVDDGGIFRRTDPRTNEGDWFALSGNLQVTEIHNIAYDSNSNILVAGSQDNGSIQQVSTGSTTWDSIFVPATIPNLTTPFRFGGDGGDVAVDDTSMPGFSIRYTSAQNFGGFRRQVYDTNNALVSQEVIGGLRFNTVGGGFDFVAEDDLFFTTPLELNQIDPTRVLVATRIGLFESNTMADDFFIVPGTNPNDPIGPTFNIVEDQNAMVFGGTKFGAQNFALTYWGVGDEVLVRTGTSAIGGVTQNLTVAQFPGREIVDLTTNTNNWEQLFVIDDENVFVTTNVGRSWHNISGDLGDFEPGALRSLRFIPGADKSAVVLGTDRGIFVSSTTDLGNWSRLGDNTLPNAPVYDLDYDLQDDVLVAGLFGRGAWTLSNVSAGITDQPRLDTLANGSVSGYVWNDVNGDGLRTANEGGVPGVRVYQDRNANGLRDATEATALTAADGSYSFLATPALFGTTSNIRLEIPAGTTQTTQTPGGAEQVAPSSSAPVTGVHFGLRTVGGGGGGGGNNGGGNNGGGNNGGGGGGIPAGSGVIAGSVYSDVDGDGMRGADEPGIGNAIIYIDANDNCAIGLGEATVSSNAAGEFAITGLAAGSYRLRMTPLPGYLHDPCASVDVVVGADGTASMSPSFAMTAEMVDLGSDGTASHRIVEGFRLGDLVTADPDPVNDNDGVVFITGLEPGATETVLIDAHQLSVSRGYLQGWIDFNGDGDWNDSGEQIFRNARLADGNNQLSFRVPAGAFVGDVRARFRWGLEYNLGAFADSLGGEVEDYIVSIPSDGNTGLMAINDMATADPALGPIIIDVLANDLAGPLGGDLTLISVSGTTAGGIVVANSDGTVTYTPPTPFRANDTFTYVVGDSFGGTATAVVTVSPAFPIALDDSFMVLANSTANALDVLENDLASADGGSPDLTITAVTTSTSEGGSASISGDGRFLLYTPAVGFTGTDTLMYTITDADGETSEATVTILVENIDPVARLRLAVTDSAGNDIDEVTIGRPFQLRVFAQDLREDPLGVFSAYLDVLVENFELIELSNLTFGSDYANARDGELQGGLINEAGATDGQTPLGGSERLLFSVDVMPLAPGEVTFIGEPADILPLHAVTLFGVDENVPTTLVSYGSDMVTIINVGAFNDMATVQEDSVNNFIDVLANDIAPPNAGPLVLAAVGATSAGGTATIEDGMIVYAPAPNFFGTETFDYTARDANGQTYTGTVTVTVNNVNDDPTANPDEFEVVQDSMSNVLDVLKNDTFLPDPPENLTITAVGPGANGAVEIAADGKSLLYTPTPGFLGQTQFSYTISDGNGGTSTAVVTVTVAEAPLMPMAAFIFRVINMDGNPVGSINAGEMFQVEVLVQDLTDAARGVFSAYLDATYDASLVTLVGAIDFNDSVYASAQKGDTSVPGLVDELGAVDGISFLNTGDPVLLATLTFQANNAGDAIFDGDPADIVPPNDTILYGSSIRVKPGEMTFISDSVMIVGNSVGGPAFTNPNNPLDVNGDTSITPLDALLVINDLNLNGSRQLVGVPQAALSGSSDGGSGSSGGEPMSSPKIDVNADGWASPLDALLVINELDRMSQENVLARAGAASGGGQSLLNDGSGEAGNEIRYATTDMAFLQLHDDMDDDEDGQDTGGYGFIFG